MNFARSWCDPRALQSLMRDGAFSLRHRNHVACIGSFALSPMRCNGEPLEATGINEESDYDSANPRSLRSTKHLDGQPAHGAIVLFGSA